jgi:hypothetical protein
MMYIVLSSVWKAQCRFPHFNQAFYAAVLNVSISAKLANTIQIFPPLLIVSHQSSIGPSFSPPLKQLTLDDI